MFEENTVRINKLETVEFKLLNLKLSDYKVKIVPI